MVIVPAQNVLRGVIRQVVVKSAVFLAVMGLFLYQLGLLRLLLAAHVKLAHTQLLLVANKQKVVFCRVFLLISQTESIILEIYLWHAFLFTADIILMHHIQADPASTALLC